MWSGINWDAAVVELGPALYRYFCSRFPGDRADDLVQKTLLRLMEKVGEQQFDPAQGNLRMYAFGIAHYIRLEAFRESGSMPLEELDPAIPSDAVPPDHQLNEQHELQRLRRAIGSLSGIHQQVIGLYLDEEVSLEDIGAILQLPVGTVKSHIHRAKQALKTALADPKEGGK